MRITHERANSRRTFTCQGNSLLLASIPPTILLTKVAASEYLLTPQSSTDRHVRVNILAHTLGGVIHEK